MQQERINGLTVMEPAVLPLAEEVKPDMPAKKLDIPVWLTLVISIATFFIGAVIAYYATRLEMAERVRTLEMDMQHFKEQGSKDDRMHGLLDKALDKIPDASTEEPEPEPEPRQARSRRAGRSLDKSDNLRSNGMPPARAVK